MNYGNNKNKLNGYPSPLATNEEKAANEYGLEYFKNMRYPFISAIFAFPDQHLL